MTRHITHEDVKRYTDNNIEADVTRLVDRLIECDSEFFESVHDAINAALIVRGEDDDHHIEIAHWYLVSDWSGEKLVSQGEVVVDSDQGPLWGREISGQAVYADGVWAEIVKECAA